MQLSKLDGVMFIIGVLISVGIGTLVYLAPTHDDHSDHHDNHPIADPADGTYHVHADFRIVVNDVLVNLDADRFQTTSTQNLHGDAHLHDNNGDVKHIHAENISFAEFLGSLGIELTASCLTLDQTYCSDEDKEVLLFVNNELFTAPLTQYVPVDNDRILLYYGTIVDELLPTYLEQVPDDACYYSGTCPERGVAPDENCGLQCVL